MEFSDWNLLKDIKELVNGFNYHLTIKNDEIYISFSKHLPQQQVAHTNYTGDIFKEELTIKNKGKASYKNMPSSAYKDIGQDVIGQKNVLSFQKTLTGKIRSISFPLGLLFEIEVFLILSEGKTIKGKKSFSDIQQLKKQNLDTIQLLTNKSFTSIIERFIHHHALTMAESINNTANNTHCADTIEFLGGAGDFNVMNRNTADIVISCSKSKNFPNKSGFSLKFGSDTRVHVGYITSKVLYTMLGGNPAIATYIGNKAKEASNTMEINKFINYLVEEMSPAFEHAVKDKKVLNNVINKILLGTELYDGISGKESIANTYLSYRDYVRNTGSSEMTNKLSKDFNLHPNDEYKLTIRKDAVVNITKTKSYISINIKGPDSIHGTTIRFAPDKKIDPSRNTFDFDVSMTNVT